MPHRLTPGPRDDLITETLADRLALVPPEQQIERELDAAEASERLAYHARDEIRRVLEDLVETTFSGLPHMYLTGVNAR